VTALASSESGLNRFRSRANASQIVDRKFEEGDQALGEVLLVADILFRWNGRVERSFGFSQEITVRDAAPAALLRGLAFVTDE
jgi:hypothetical protein